MSVLLDPKNDLVFKMLFTAGPNTGPLESLLSAVLCPPDPIVELEILNPELPKNLSGDRGIFLDIHAKLSNGQHVNVEMQMSKRNHEWARMHYHWARLFSQQLKRGESFSRLVPSTVIFLNNFRQLPLAPEHFHLTFLLGEIERRAKLSDFMRLDLIQLPEIFNLPISMKRGDKGSDLLLDWCRFILDPMAPAWREKIMSNQNIAEADERLKRLSEDRKARELARQREFSELDWNTGIQDALEQGMAIGKQEGMVIGKQEGVAIGKEAAHREIARNMQKQGRSESEIGILLNLSTETVQKYLGEP